jgi:GH18 family chitinase
MAQPDNFDPLVPIPNNEFFTPFNYPQTWTFAPAGGPGGPPAFIFGAGFTIVGQPFSVNVAQLPPPIIGTVYKVTAGTGLVSAPVTGIRVSGSLALAPVVPTGGNPPLVPGAFKYVSATVDQYGRTVFASSGSQPILSGLGLYPITVSGVPPTLTVTISPASTSNLGSTQLADDVVTQSSTEALTANQGYILNSDLNAIPVTPVNGQFYAGSLNPTTGKLISASVLGNSSGYTAGQSLPFPGGSAVEGYVVVAGSGSYDPPGPGGPYNVLPGDELYCGNGQWLLREKAFRYPYATDTIPGIVEFATQSEVRPFTNTTLVCTPYSLANLIATNTEIGWILIATDAECRALLTPLKAVTPANLSATPATLFDRGIVQLNNSTTSTSITEAATPFGVSTVFNSAILKSQINAVGDLITATASATPFSLPRGANQYLLTVDDSKPEGVAWKPLDPPQSTPVGTIFWFGSSSGAKLPADWAWADGAAVSAAPETSPGVPNPYYDLFQVIGYTFGGSGATFNLPDLRGKFIRGWSGSGGTNGSIDAPRTFGSTQTSDVIGHTHNFTGLGHDHNPITVVDPGHNHSAAAATVIGPPNGYFSGKANCDDGFLADGTRSTNISMSTVDYDPALNSPGVYKTTLVNTAPTPTDQTRPVNFALTPIIRYTYGTTPPTPLDPNDVVYYVTANPTTIGASATTNVTVLTANVARGTTLYWQLSGPNVTSSLFSPPSLTGTTTVGYSNLATFGVTTAASLPQSPYSLQIKLFSDAGFLNQVGNAAFVTLNSLPTYSVATSPLAASNNGVLTTTINTTNVSNGTTLYWSLSGTGVTSAFFTSGSLTGTTTVNSNVATFTNTLAASLPAGGPYTVVIKVYSDAARTVQVSSDQAVIVTPSIAKTFPTFGAYIDLYQYRNTGGVYPAGSYVGLNPNMRATNINTILPTLDWFYMLLEAQLYNDGKLYFGTNPGVAAALLLNAGGTDWANNTGSISGGYVSPTNPDYAFSAYAIKNSVYYLSQQSAWTTKNFLLSIGGYNLSQFMDQAGANATVAQTAADQIATLIQITGAVGVDLDYEPVGQACVPANMALLCQKIYAAVKALNPTYEVHLTLIPPLSQADPDLKIATAVACQSYVDQINVMTYDDPNNLYQPPYEPGSVTVNNHTGVGRSVQSVQWFINGGVSRAKLGMGIAGYGRNSAAGQAFTNSGTPYDQIVRVAGASVATSYEFKLGRFSGTVPIVNPAPTSQADYYDNPTNALWGFDSIDTITNKVKSSSNMGLRSVFMWQISNDYSNPASVAPAGDPLANFALIKGAQVAIANL